MSPSDAFPPICMDPRLLSQVCREVAFAPGEELRVKGRLSVDMYLITSGEVEIRPGHAANSAPKLTAGRGSPIGEIGFLTGTPATATVTAKTEVRALYIDKSAWRLFERQMPEAAVAFYRELAEIAEGRRSYNTLFDTGEKTGREGAPDTILCQRPDQLLEAQRIRYRVYCEELGRTSPYADPVKGTISDNLDVSGHVLLAIRNGTPVATIRLNMSRDGGLGILEQLYCMSQSENHPNNTGIVTKFIVRSEYRRNPVAFNLMATAVEMAQRYDIKECFMDCIPQLAPFFISIGFVQAGPPFLHYENGRSLPLRLDVNQYAKRIFRLTGLVIQPPSSER